MLDPVNMASRATIVHRRTTLATLPRPSEVNFKDRPPWAPISTADLVAALNVDRGNWATWACRGGIVPAALPAQWFRSAGGRPRSYRIDTIAVWLASRHGERTDSLTVWHDWLVAHVGIAADAPEEVVRGWAHRFAQSKGPAEGRFTGSGFANYLGTLLRGDVL